MGDVVTYIFCKCLHVALTLSHLRAVSCLLFIPLVCSAIGLTQSNHGWNAGCLSAVRDNFMTSSFDSVGGRHRAKLRMHHGR